ncbi:hypothetical protein GCM10007100_09210 [Roseibacillus persicicus]|uniref:Uncharacterized protein n=1 Tax=Roseibacillus persicicus TaxID=454148 RepID=A0A918TKD1_9BACT|nr:hypothetical protein GCM10007100_09210 [Roseibacillus persicicus]
MSQFLVNPFPLPSAKAVVFFEKEEEKDRDAEQKKSQLPATRLGGEGAKGARGSTSRGDYWEKEGPLSRI